eukprot:gene25170-30719_t
MGQFAIYEVEGTVDPISSLHDAAERNDLKSMGAFLRKRGANVNKTDRYGRTALMWASECGHVDAVELLLRQGADVDIKDAQMQRTALHWAARALRNEVIDVNVQDKYMINPLFLAQQKGEEGAATVKLLMESGAKFGLDTVTAGNYHPELESTIGKPNSEEPADADADSEKENGDSQDAT